jgi:hypothetical protein
MKTCKKCGKPQDEENFAKHSRTKDGLRAECRGCSTIYMRQYRAKNRAVSPLPEEEAVRDTQEPVEKPAPEKLIQKLSPNWLDDL